MTHERDIERLLDRWLDDGPSIAPDRVIDVVADRIDRVPQRLAWRASRRDPNVNPYLKPLLAVAAVIAIAVAFIAVIVRPSGPEIGAAAESASPSPSPLPTQSASPVAAATPPWDDGPGPCGLNGRCGGPETPGTYTSTGLNPPVTYTLTTNWVNNRDWEDFFVLYPDTPANRASAASGGATPYILILAGTAVSPSAACQEDLPTDEIEVNAAQFVEFVSTRARLTTTSAIPVTISGLSGQQVDARIQPGWTGCIPGTPLSEVITPADSVRFIVLDRPGDTSLMVRLRAPTESESFFGEAMPVVESFVFNLTK